MDDHLAEAFDRLCLTWRETADQWDDGQYEQMATEYMTPLIEQTQRYLDVLEALDQAIQTHLED